MSILGKIFGRIFPGAHAQQQPAPAGAQPGPSAGSAVVTPNQVPTPTARQPAGAGAATASPERVDIEKVLDDMASKNPQKLNWRTSIVDMMKLVGMDSTLQERRELAEELGYSGDKNDTSAMNMWLHKAVLRKLQENGGKVPANLLD
jgi:hypothetical protein